MSPSFRSIRGAGRSTEPHIRLLICSKQRMLRAGLRLLIKADKSIIVVGEADSTAAMLTVAQSKRPDVILLDDELCEHSRHFVDGSAGERPVRAPAPVD